MRAPNSDWILATDLDGTLLDRSYNLEEAATALNDLLDRWTGVRHLVLATSKTLDELLPFSAMIDRLPVLIFENGAGYAVPSIDQTGAAVYATSTEGPGYSAIRDTLVRLRTDYQLSFTGFGDMSDAQLSGITGLSRKDARRAKNRHASEPLLWADSPQRLAQFRDDLAKEQLELVRGGQFLHVSSAVNKWNAIQRWRKQVASSSRLLACGDAPNDLLMLSHADQAIVFPDANGNYLLNPSATLCHANSCGVVGWREAVENALAEHCPEIPLQSTTV